MCFEVVNFYDYLELRLIEWMTFTLDDTLQVSIVHTIIVKYKLAIIPLNNHVMGYHTCFHYKTNVFFFHGSAQPHTMTSQVYSIPKPHSTSFLADS